jgi:hypothetical protein
MFTSHIQRAGIRLTALLGGASVLMPWARIGPFSLNGTSVDAWTGGFGWIILALFAISFGLSAGGDKKSQLNLIITLTISMAMLSAACLGVWKLLIFSGYRDSLMNGICAGAESSSAYPTFGLYLVILTGLAGFILAWWLRHKQVNPAVG